jgi:nitrate reductase delta subunit
MMHTAEVIALGYHYPTPLAADELSVAIEENLRGRVEHDMRRFLEGVGLLSLGEWEELHTSTLDLSPKFVPYVGHVVWGENYRRGEFMAELKAAMTQAGVDLGGELPDHIEPVLRYISAVPDPLADLIEVLPGAATSMRDTLRKVAPDNPYCHLLAATVAFTHDHRPLPIGGRG